MHGGRLASRACEHDTVHMDADEARQDYDVVIVGGGPAGLSAALILGRCGRRILVCDRGTPRSWASKGIHGFITRDGIPPDEFRSLALAELARYPTVSFATVEVHQAAPATAGFLVTLDTGVVRARKLLIATGVADHLPEVEGLQSLFGISVFQCPYCDAFEFRDRRIAAYGKRGRGFEMARALTAWSKDVLLCTDGAAGYDAADLAHLDRNGIELEQSPVVRLEARNGVLDSIVFRNGRKVARDALFFDTPTSGQSDLTGQLGCRFNRHGGVLCGKYEATSVPGVYVAGNIIRNVQLSIVAAAEGASAAFGINRALTREDFEKHATGASILEHTAPQAPE